MNRSSFCNRQIITLKLCLCIMLFISVNDTAAQNLETVIQKGHELAVLTVAVSPDSNYVATGGRDKTIKLWELSTGREVRSFLGHSASVNQLDFSSDGKTLISANGDATAKIWEVATGKELFSIKPDEERITDVAYDPKGRFFVTVGFGQKVRVWDVTTKKKLTEMDANGYAGSGGLIHVAISKDGEWLAVGEDGFTANVYRCSDWKKTYTFNTSQLHSSCGGCYTDVQFTPDSKYLIKASNNDAVLKYDLSNGKLVTTYSKEVNDLRSVSISANGKLVAICTENTVSIYNADQGDLIKSIQPDVDAALNQTSFTTDGKRLLMASDNNTVMIFDITSGKQVKELTGFLNARDKGGLTYNPNSYWDANIAKYLRFKGNVVVSRDNKTLLRGKFGTKAKRWDIATGKTEMEYVGHEKAVLCYRYNSDGSLLLTGGADGMLILWDAKKGDTLRTIKSYNQPVFDVNFSNDETKMVSSSWDGSLKIHEVSTGKRLTYIDLDNASAYLAQFTPNDLYVLTANLPTGLVLREVDTKKVIREFIGHTETVSAMQLTRDGRKLLSASWDGSIRLWDVGTGLMENKYTGHSGAIYASIMTGSEKNFYSAGADRIIRYWDIVSGKVIKTFSGHQSEVMSLALTADEKMLISHSVDGVTKFWDLTSGNEFFEHIHIGEKDWMAKSPEGYFNATEQARRYIHFVEGMKTYSADQFFEDFYRPDLLPKIFQSRGGDDGYKSMQGKLLKSPPPHVKVALLPSSEKGKAELYVRVQDNGAGVENFKLFHNGKSVLIDKKFALPKGKGQVATFKTEVSLVGGNNTFSATASNLDRVEADPHSVEVFSDIVTKNSTCYLLAVGINQYKNPKLVLNYAKPDAESFKKVINEMGISLHKKLEIHTLYDGEATRTGILNKLDELSAKINQEDVFIFYYAGHGSMVDDQFFFIPTESLRLYDLNSLQKEAIEGSVLQEKFKKIQALKQLIIMDACQSGGSVELMATRGATEEKAIAQLSRSAGIHVMASAGSEQFAAEFAELGHGIFTYLLIKGLSGEADGSPKDGKVTIYELKSFLDDQVPELTRKLKGKPQYPHTFSRGQDFPLVVEE